MGGGSGRPSVARSIHQNLNRLTREFGPLRHGYFGERGSSSDRRRIASSDPVTAANRFFSLSTRNGPAVTRAENGTPLVLFRDGSSISIRFTSSDGSPSIQLTTRRSLVQIRPPPPTKQQVRPPFRRGPSASPQRFGHRFGHRNPASRTTHQRHHQPGGPDVRASGACIDAT